MAVMIRLVIVSDRCGWRVTSIGWRSRARGNCTRVSCIKYDTGI